MLLGFVPCPADHNKAGLIVNQIELVPDLLDHRITYTLKQTKSLRPLYWGEQKREALE